LIGVGFMKACFDKILFVILGMPLFLLRFAHSCGSKIGGGLDFISKKNINI